MKLNHTHARQFFLAHARQKEGYRPAYKLLFDTLLDELERINLTRSEQARQLALDYDMILPHTGQNRKLFYQGVNWLHEAGFIEYPKGLGYVIFRNIPDEVNVQRGRSLTSSVTHPVTHIVTPTVTSPVTTAVTKEIEGVTEVVTSPVTQPGVEPKTPPHPPIEVINNINTTSQAGAPACVVPSNIVLSPDELSDLIGGYGIDKVKLALMKVSKLKRDNGGRLNKSDFHNVVSWAIQQVEADALRLSRQAHPPAKSIQPTYKPSTSTVYGREIT